MVLGQEDDEIPMRVTWTKIAHLDRSLAPVKGNPVSTVMVGGAMTASR